MKNYNYYLFDLDGTLIDTVDLICECFRHTAQETENISLTKEEILPNIGLPLRDQMCLYFGKMTESEYKLKAAYHMCYQELIYKAYIKCFDGVKDTLSKLKRDKKQLSVVTSRALFFAEEYLEYTGIYPYFDYLITPELTNRHKPHAEPALKAMDLMSAVPEETLLVGDSDHDIECGTRANIDTAFVMWSHNTLGQLKAKPTWTINNMYMLQ